MCISINIHLYNIHIYTHIGILLPRPQNHPYPCGLKYSDYPWTDVQLTTYQKDVHVPAGYPQLEKEKYRGFLGDIKMLKLFVSICIRSSDW